MKKVVLIIYLALLSSTYAFSQAVLSTQTKIELSKKNTNSNQRTAENYISVFLHVENGLSQELITSKGVQVNTVVGNIWSIRATLSQLEVLAKTPGVLYIEVAPTVHKKIDAAKLDANVNKVNDGLILNTKYTGKGVIIGIIDTGFDFTHPVFKDTSGTKLRIARVWDQTASGTKPSSFSYGAEYDNESAILTKAHTGHGSHGTHVASIAGGSGIKIGNTWSQIGVAQDAEFVLVQYGDSNSSIADALNYIYKYAASVSKPVVVNMSLGSHIGPHDGNSTQDKLFDGLVGNGKILVGAVGNEGSIPLHLSKTFLNDTIKTLVEFEQASGRRIGTIDIWAGENEQFDYTINANSLKVKNKAKPISKFSQFLSSNTSLQEQSDFLNIGTDTLFATCTATPYNNVVKKSNVRITFATNADSIFAELVLTSKTGSVHVWNHGVGTGAALNGDGVLITKGNVNSTNGEIGGTGKSVISVGAYTTTNAYTNFDKNDMQASFYTELGAIAPFSSKGPTVDGRRKPDITAPGNVIAAAISSFDTTYNVGGSNRGLVSYEFIQNGKTYRFAYEQGTSMASPFITGVVALMLQANPNLTPQQIKDIFDLTTRKGAEIGSNPNTWGAGKIDAYAAVLKVNSVLGIENAASNPLEGIKVYPNPTSKSVSIDIAKDGEYDISIVDLTGKVLIENQKVNGLGNKIALDNLQTGLYSVIIKGQNTINTLRLIINQ